MLRQGGAGRWRRGSGTSLSMRSGDEPVRSQVGHFYGDEPGCGERLVVADVLHQLAASALSVARDDGG